MKHSPGAAVRPRPGRPSLFCWALVLVIAFGAPARLHAAPARAGDTETGADDAEARIKVAYILNFLKFVDWPGEDSATSSRPLRICVAGTDPVRILLDDLSRRTVGNRPIEVTPVRNRNALPSCDLLYIGRSLEEELPRLLMQVRGTPVLTVSDIPQFARLGGMIGFVTVEDRVRIEIHPPAVHEAGLKARAKLLEIARIVP